MSTTLVCAETAVRCYNGMVVAILNISKNESAAHIKSVDEQWMRLALEQAAEAMALGEVPVGAVAVLNEQVIGAGFNRKESDHDPTAHAEMIALRQAAAYLSNWRLLGVTLYCTLEPCPMCAGAMIQGRLSRLVYGAQDTRFGADGTIVDVLRQPAFNHQVVITTGVLAEEAGELLQQFFRTLRKAEG
jgi:tRNA(adenine34) deaminase